MPKKILIVHLVSNGDCLMMTAIARQIKSDNPGCHITWMISYKCKQVIENNPYVDVIWEVQYQNHERPDSDVWQRMKNEAEERKKKGEFDAIFYSQIYPDNLHHFDGTTRSSTFRTYPKPITVDVTPTIRLYDEEIRKVKDFSHKNELEKYKHVVLCECIPASKQSFMSLELMLTLAKEIVNEREDIIFIISTHLKVLTGHPRIIDGSVLSYRENAELSKFCTLLLGCSSGITWLLTSDWAKKINSIQFLSDTNMPFCFASVIYDFKYWKLSSNHILETTDREIYKIKKIITSSLTDFQAAKKEYGQILVPSIQMLKNNLYNIFSPFSFSAIKKSFYCINIFFVRNNISRIKIIFFVLFLSKIAVRKSINSLKIKN